MADFKETDLYPPIKRFLESQGYGVKGEVVNCDVVAMRDEEEPVVVELKTAFTLALVFQGVRRQALTDHVYLAVPMSADSAKPALWRRHHRDILKLCRQLGLGLIVVHFSSGGELVEVHLDPVPYRPRKDKRRRNMLLREFQRRSGDPSPGGVSKRPIVTAYRQDALKCARFLQQHGATKAAAVRTGTGVARAPRILLRDVYGWFHRVERGIYALTPNGKQALALYADVVGQLG